MNAILLNPFLPFLILMEWITLSSWSGVSFAAFDGEAFYNQFSIQLGSQIDKEER